MRKNIESLKELYAEIQKCDLCKDMNHNKALRVIDAVSPFTDVFVVSEALAENQLRKTGVNYFNMQAELDGTGIKFEKFLNQISRTLYPYKNITLKTGKVIPKTSNGSISIYNTETAQCFPGKRRRIVKGKPKNLIRPPSSIEINNCMSKKFLENEIRAIKPKLIFLQGKKSRDTLYKFYIKENHPSSLEDHIKQIINSGELPRYQLFGRTVSVCPIIHSSGAARGSWPIMEDQKFMDIIKKVFL